MIGLMTIWYHREATPFDHKHHHDDTVIPFLFNYWFVTGKGDNPEYIFLEPKWPIILKDLTHQMKVESPKKEVPLALGL